MQRSFEVIAGTDPVRAPGFTPVISSMDVPRPHIARQKRKRRLIIAAASVLGIILITVVVSRLKPAAMSVDRAAVWVDTVKRGPMLRQVRGLGTLVPEDIRAIDDFTRFALQHDADLVRCFHLIVDPLHRGRFDRATAAFIALI